MRGIEGHTAARVDKPQKNCDSILLQNLMRSAKTILHVIADRGMLAYLVSFQKCVELKLKQILTLL